MTTQPSDWAVEPRAVVKANRCLCCYESCCCGPMVLVLDGEEIATGFSGPLQKIANAVNDNYRESLARYYEELRDLEKFSPLLEMISYAVRSAKMNPMRVYGLDLGTLERIEAEIGRLSADVCIAVYDAVSRSNITRDVKTPEKKVCVVRHAMGLSHE